jgi:3'-5' exonuclease
MISNIFLDIETIPGETFMARQAMEAVRPPATYKKKESIDAWWQESGEAAKKAAMHSLGLHPAYCKIVALSWAINDKSPTTYYGDDEKATLEVFLEDLKSALGAEKCGYSYRLVGHNIVGFDLPVIYTRCMLNGINSPLLYNPREIKPWDTQKVFDTLYHLSGGNTKGWSLGNCSKLFGIPDKFPDADGSMVWESWRQGQHSGVADYCENDVEIVRHLFNCMRDYYL